MQVVKKLVISSPDELFRLVGNQFTLLEKSQILMSFCDNLMDYYHGCRCLESFYLEKVMTDIREISQNSDTISILKEYFKCDQIIFDLK